MIRFKSDPIELFSRLGRVGSIRTFDLWQFRESQQAMIEGVAQIASLSYGNEAAKNPLALYERIISLGHLSCLEFVPLHSPILSVLPKSSLRNVASMKSIRYDKGIAENCSVQQPAYGFLVECPIFVARQWMRHRSFSYLEMSRRYVKGEKVALEFYGAGADNNIAQMACEGAALAYDRLIEIGQPPELARRVLPVGMMTKFFVGGFYRDWHKFVALRSDAHAQAEIRIFSDAIAQAIA